MFHNSTHTYTVYICITHILIVIYLVSHPLIWCSRNIYIQYIYIYIYVAVLSSVYIMLCNCMDLFCVLELDELKGTSGTHPERNERVRLTFTHQTPLIQTHDI